MCVCIGSALWRSCARPAFEICGDSQWRGCTVSSEKLTRELNSWECVQSFMRYQWERLFWSVQLLGGKKLKTRFFFVSFKIQDVTRFFTLFLDI